MEHNATRHRAICALLMFVTCTFVYKRVWPLFFQHGAVLALSRRCGRSEYPRTYLTRIVASRWCIRKKVNTAEPAARLFWSGTGDCLIYTPEHHSDAGGEDATGRQLPVGPVRVYDTRARTDRCLSKRAWALVSCSPKRALVACVEEGVGWQAPQKTMAVYDTQNGRLLRSRRPHPALPYSGISTTVWRGDEPAVLPVPLPLPPGVQQVEWTRYDASWSPTKGEVVVGTGSVAQEDLYLLNLKTGIWRQLTSGSSHDACPQFSPDGLKIAFLSSRANAGGDLYTTDPSDGSAVPRREIWVLDLRRPHVRPEQLTHTGVVVGDFKWSLDGRWIAYRAKFFHPRKDDWPRGPHWLQDDEAALWAMNLRTGRTLRVSRRVMSYAWRPVR